MWDISILQSAGIPTQINLPSIGTNLQDQALDLFAYLLSPTVPPSEYTIENAPGALAAAYLDFSQLFSGQEGEGSALMGSVEQRARTIVETGAFTSLSGMEKILRVQARNIVESKGLRRRVVGKSSLDEYYSSDPGVSVWNCDASWWWWVSWWGYLAACPTMVGNS
jgi:hypothetical protein